MYFYQLDCNDPCCLALNSQQTPIMKNRLLTTIRKLKKQYYLHVEFKITEPFPTKGYYSIYHATISGDADVYGSRTPGIWIRHDNGNMYIHTSSTVNGNRMYEYNTPTTTVQLNKWITINISQTKVGDDYEYKVEIDGEVRHVVKNTQPQEFLNVKIYISDPWVQAVPGYVRNVYIKGKV